MTTTQAASALGLGQQQTAAVEEPLQQPRSSPAQRSNPFATAKEAHMIAANEACEASDFKLAAVHSAPMPPPPVSTGAAAAAAGGGAGASSSSSSSRAKRKQLSFSRVFSCSCTSPAVRESDDGQQPGAVVVAGRGAGQQQQHPQVHWQPHLGSPKRSLRPALTQQASVYSDAEWFDSRSEFSSVLSNAASNQAAKIEELSAMLREMYPNGQQQAAAAAAAAAGAAVMPGPMRPLALAKAPHIPEPPLIFGPPDIQFVPVPAFTGFSAYWERDPVRSTGYPSPIDQLTRCSALAQRSHASIPGITLRETDTIFNAIVKPRFMPSGFPCYTETYDKSNATTPSWNLRRDLRLGSTVGNIYFTVCGMLILRAKARPVFGSSPDYVTEEYIRLESGGDVLVDRMCCMEIKTGKTATQYIVGHRRPLP